MAFSVRQTERNRNLGKPQKPLFFQNPTQPMAPASVRMPAPRGPAPASAPAARRSTPATRYGQRAPIRQPARTVAPRISSNNTGRISRTAAPAAVAPAPAPPPPPPAPPSIQDYLGTDEGYIQQKSAIDQAIADYLAQMGQQQTAYNTDFDSQLKDLGVTRERSLEDMVNDFAGRGLLRSGLYTDADADLRNDFSRRETDLNNDKTRFMGDLETGKTNFMREQDLTRQRAEQEAIARRAAKFGL